MPKKFEKVGIPNLPITINYSKLFTIKKQHNLTLEGLKQIPRQLQNPTMIFKNKRDRSPANSFVVLTEIEDANNKPVIVALHANRINQKLEVNQIASIHGRDISQIENALKHNELLYYHQQKSQLMMSRLQLPSSSLADLPDIITNKTIKGKSTKQRLQERRAKG